MGGFFDLVLEVTGKQPLMVSNAFTHLAEFPLAPTTIRYRRFLGDFAVLPITGPLGISSDWNRLDDLCGANQCPCHPTLPPHDHRPRRPGPRPHLRFGHHRLCRRTMGTEMDRHRHLPGGPGPLPGPDHGGLLSLLSPRRLRRRAAEGGRSFGPGLCPKTDLHQHPLGLCLPARSPYHPQEHRQQHRDRRALPGTPAPGARRPQESQRRTPGPHRSLWDKLRRPGREDGGFHRRSRFPFHHARRPDGEGVGTAGVGDSPGEARRLARCLGRSPRALLEREDGPAEGDRRLHRRQGGF